MKPDIPQRPEHQELTGLDILDRGDSLYTDIPRETDRLHLYAEAVTLEQSAQARAVHQEQMIRSPQFDDRRRRQ